MLKLDDIIDRIHQYHPHADVDLLARAYAFAVKAHEGQWRKSGQPYVVHPLEVAAILADMKLDMDSVAAGMLHDTIEDTGVTRDDIAKAFGEEIANLVEGVTKLSKLQFHNQQDRQAENFRKMLLAMAKDIRVILIKLADRLNNLKTLQFMSEEKQVTIATETLDIYAPLANRLGIEWMKAQLEDLSFRFLKPAIYQQIEKKLTHLAKSRGDYMEKVQEMVRHHFKGSIENFDISGRMKHFYSIYQKMERSEISFEQVFDVFAFRILTDSVEECYEALGLIHSLWKPIPGRFKDYIAMPKANHYQSLHTTVICLDGQRVEFQIRTYQMNEINENGIASHWKYKEGGVIDMKDEATFRWLRQLVNWQDELTDSIEFLDTVKLDLFASEIYVFTPKGDVRALPHGATAIDFAYSIHSDVGNHCSGARINGRIMPLGTPLSNGDQVEIMTLPQARPSRDWIEMAISSRAKAKIRQYIKQEQREKSVRLGKNLFENECDRHHISPDLFLKNEEVTAYLSKKGIVGKDQLFAALAYGKVSMTRLFELIGKAIMPPSSPDQEDGGIIKRIFRKVSARERDVVKVDGLDDVLMTYGKCCLPLPGDAIVGFITRGRGVTLHRVECSTVPSIDVERRVNAVWNKNARAAKTARLGITCEDQTGMLAGIAQVISEKKINITRALVRTTRDKKALISLDVTVSHLSELLGIMKEVEKVKGVISVDRRLG